MILRMPKGYETDVGEAGRLLSGGPAAADRASRGRSMASRVLVVLDEPNASLDAAGEEALNGAVSALKAKGTTIVIVAHRPSLLGQVDKIALLLDGQLKAFGPRDAVLNHMKQRRPPAPPRHPSPR